jgi:anthranilate synthase/aminodeoxychorismate synthase-like glutamine amidotransferase
MILVIDNYDSFTYNLVQYLGELGEELVVRRNDAVDVEEIGTMAPEAIVLSPGPCTPTEAGVTVPVIQRWGATVPMLGVCLGHQAIGEAYGGRVVRARRVMHGKTSVVKHDGRTLFEGLPQPAEVGRYHSLIAEPGTMPAELEVTASTAEGEIMGVRHRKYTIEGVQFHPESVLTPQGPQLMGNFLRLTSPLRGGQGS